MRYLTREQFDNPCNVMPGDQLKITHNLYDGPTPFAVGEYEFEVGGLGVAIGVEREFEILQNGYDFTVAEPKVIWDVNHGGPVRLVKDNVYINGVSMPTPLASPKNDTPPSQTCPDCRGKGKIELFTSIETCTNCHGVGRI